MTEGHELHIIWHKKEVGIVKNPLPDMWYVEGDWMANETSDAQKFEALVKTFQAQDVLRDPQKGTRVELWDTNNSERTHALVISLNDNTLFLRHVFASDAIAWLLENVT